jgi:hypothetical protein
MVSRASGALAQGGCNYLRGLRLMEQVMESAFDPVKSSTIIMSLFSSGTDGA